MLRKNLCSLSCVMFMGRTLVPFLLQLAPCWRRGYSFTQYVYLSNTYHAKLSPIICLLIYKCMILLALPVFYDNLIIMRKASNKIFLAGTEQYEEEKSPSGVLSEATPEQSSESVPVYSSPLPEVDSRGRVVPITTLSTDPYSFPWPPSLPLELALEPGHEEEILARYNLSMENLETLLVSNAFKLAYQNARKSVGEEGLSFKLKARLLAEHHLVTVDDIINTPTVAASTKGDLIGKLVKWGGLETDPSKKDTGVGSVNIQINL